MLLQVSKIKKDKLLEVVSSNLEKIFLVAVFLSLIYAGIIYKAPLRPDPQFECNNILYCSWYKVYPSKTGLRQTWEAAKCISGHLFAPFDVFSCFFYIINPELGVQFPPYHLVPVRMSYPKDKT